jgi:peptidoglycan hydrolase CwlO-like protein
MDVNNISSVAEERYNAFLFTIQQNPNECNSSDLQNTIKKLRAEREKAIKKRRMLREKVDKSLKELKYTENEIAYLDNRLRSTEGCCQTTLMKEAQLDEKL